MNKIKKFKFLRFLARKEDSHEELLYALSGINAELFKDITCNEFSRLYRTIKSLLNEKALISEFLDLHIISNYLIHKDKAHDWFSDWINDNICVSKFFPGYDSTQIMSGKWCVVPVFHYDNIGGADITNVLAGMLDKSRPGLQWLKWADSLLGPESKKAAEDAFLAVKKKIGDRQGFKSGESLICFPLTQANKTVQLTGKSLGLPLAIAFWSLLSGERINPYAAASGVVEKDGTISIVSNLNEKIERASQKKEYRFFLYPFNNYAKPETKKGIEPLPVATIDDAFMFLELYSPGRGYELIQFAAILNQPDNFAVNCKSIAYQWLDIVHRQGKTKNVLQAIIESPPLFSLFTETFNELVKNWNLDKALLVSSMIRKEDLEKLKQKSPFAVFKWCTVNHELNNHKGALKEGEKWVDYADSLLEYAISANIELVADYYNNKFVYQQNTYSFKPELPLNLDEITKSLSGIYSIRQAAGCIVYDVLGRLYGTIAQNYGFCGYDYIEYFENYSDKAIEAFGQGRVPEYKEDFRRQLNYKAYAYMDGEQYEKAESVILKYLNCKSLDDWLLQLGKCETDIWGHALVCRYIADSKKKTGG